VTHPERLPHALARGRARILRGRCAIRLLQAPETHRGMIQTPSRAFQRPRRTGVRCRHTCLITTCPGPARTTRLDPVCARDSFGALSCALFRGRAGNLRGSPCWLPRAIFTCIHICIYIYTHMYITHPAVHSLALSCAQPLFQAPRMWTPSRSFQRLRHAGV